MTCRINAIILLMIWYLLSPLRGTTDPPRLSATHPIRTAFYRHGKTTAQHWLVAMLVSVAIAMGFSYPTLLESPTAGFAAFPHQVWTTARPLDDGNPNVDAEMRQIWLHASYMKALDKSVLKQALAVQHSLVGNQSPANISSIDGESGSTTLQWGYHSPLIYWNNSAEAIDADTDLLKTINEQKHISSSLNVMLRPASVFAGKKFAGQQLHAADALVITLINKGGDPVGTEWQEKMQALPEGACTGCMLFPDDGHVTRQRVYEFSFTPLSIQEHIALTFAYSAMALYVLLSMRRMKAFHSRFGLVVTAITQMTFSILASFTICGMILKINLSMIPQNAYPFVVLVLGVENMFRLINAVLAYPPTMATELRIANALGDVGPISLAAAAQNLTILSLLSTVVSPGVAAFCYFAAAATLFDAFFLLTFFVAVLNVDIRRLELQDAIAARHSQSRHKRRPSPAHSTWFDALSQGRIPFSTRMAGTAVMTTFVLSLNYHFFEDHGQATNLRRLLDLVRGSHPSVDDLDTFTPPPMNATLTPSEWMRMQDFDTAREVMSLARPGADSFVIRVFSPLIVVLGGSDRADISSGHQELVHALRSFAIHHFYPVAVAIVFGVAFVAVLMNFLLYNEAGDEDNEIALAELEDCLALQAVGLPHKLDIVKMASNEKGYFVTIALDRTIAIADVNGGAHQCVSVPSHVLNTISWPVRQIAIDDSGEWIACHCRNESILAYNHRTGVIIPAMAQYPDQHAAVLFAFLPISASGGSRLYFLALTSGGRLSMSCMDDGTSLGADISNVRLIGASILDTSAHGRQLIIVTEDAKVISHSWTSNAWLQAATQTLRLRADHDRSFDSAKLQLYADLDTELVIVTTSTTATILASSDLAQIAFLDLKDVPTPIEQFLVGPSRRCPACGSLAFRQVAIVGSAKKGNDCALTTWSADDGGDGCICLAQNTAACTPFEKSVQNQHTISQPDVWTLVQSPAVLGVRRHRTAETSMPTTSPLRQRKHTRQTAKMDIDPVSWEAFRLSVEGDIETLDIPLELNASLEDGTNLYVNNAGPVVSLDSQSVAVAFGNNVKIIRAARRTPISRRSIERQSSVSRSAARKA